MQDKQKLLKIGDLAKRADITVRTIRYYEELGLLSPSETSQGGFRLYTEEDLRKLRFIKRFKELDFPLEQIINLINSPDNDLNINDRMKLSLFLLEKQLGQVEDKIKHFEDLKSEIKEAINSVNQCVKCNLDSCVPGCPHKEAIF